MKRLILMLISLLLVGCGSRKVKSEKWIVKNESEQEARTEVREEREEEREELATEVGLKKVYAVEIESLGEGLEVRRRVSPAGEQVAPAGDYEGDKGYEVRAAQAIKTRSSEEVWQIKGRGVVRLVEREEQKVNSEKITVNREERKESREEGKERRENGYEQEAGSMVRKGWSPLWVLGILVGITVGLFVYIRRNL